MWHAWGRKKRPLVRPRLLYRKILLKWATKRR